MLRTGALSNVDFVLSSGKRVGAHRQILAARSEVFLRMFTGGYREGASDDQVTTDIDVSDIEDDVFETFLSFVYTGAVDPSFFARSEDDGLMQDSSSYAAGKPSPPSSGAFSAKKTSLGKRKRVSRRSSVGSAASLP